MIKIFRLSLYIMKGMIVFWRNLMVKNAWGLVDAFFDEYKLVDHHIKSYNDFVDHRIQDIIDITEPIVLEQGEYSIKTGN